MTEKTVKIDSIGLDFDKTDDEIAKEAINNMLDNASEVEYVWVPDQEEVWRLVPFIRQNLQDNEVTVMGYEKNEQNEIIEKEQIYSLNDVQYLDGTHLDDLDDLCLMNNLHEAPLLNMLKRRFMKSNIYSAAGNILISVNPYRLISGLYDDPLSYFIPSRSFDLESVNAKETPHLFKTANQTFVSFLDTSHNQSVIISGESGAGKTESSKYVMQFLLAANEKRGGSQLGVEIKHVLSASNYVFEAFGNAKTVRNDNSSRFGKFIKLQYDLEKNLVSAFTETFLLEKSRLSHVGYGERNYHIFYEMIRGLPDNIKNELFITDIDTFPILTDGECTQLDSIEEDIVEFGNVVDAMKALHFCDQEAYNIWSLLSGVLHLSSIKVTEKDHNISDGGEQGCDLTSTTRISLAQIAGLLGCEEEDFVSHISYQIVTMGMGRRNSIIKKHLSGDAVRQNILALNKWLYNGLFLWIVKKINYVHATVGGKVPDVEKDEMLNYIGIMDIFGFEIFEINSFEQLCINFTNERLQQQFNEHVFVNEQKEYEAEGLDWKTIGYKDNQEVIDLISKKPHGLLNVLEEFGMLNRKADDGALLSKYLQAHQGPPGKKKAGEPPPLFSKPRFGEMNFIIRHFAGSVEYCVTGFITKNNDSLQEDIMNLIKRSNNMFLLNIMGLANDSTQPGYVASFSKESEDDLTAKGHGTKAKGKMAASTTVSLKFRRQLDHLMATLRSTIPNYIRCIKPNQGKSAFEFNPHLVNEQLKYSGVMEVVRIRREGFPQRFFFEEFCKPYSILMRDRRYKQKFLRRTTMDTKKIYQGNNARFSGELVPTLKARRGTCKVPLKVDEKKEKSADSAALVDENEEAKWKGATEDIASIFLPASEYHIGTNKIFLRANGLIMMNLAVRRFFDANATKIQSAIRMKRIYIMYERCRAAFMIVQTRIRGFLARRLQKKSKDAAIRIKSLMIAKRARKQFLKERKAAQVIQRHALGFLLRCRYLRSRNRKANGALTIQCFYRQKVAQRSLKKHRAASVAIQSMWRGRRASLQFQAQRNAALLIQANVRRHQATKEYNVVLRSVVLIQSLSRQMVSRHSYNKKRLAATNIQCVVRRNIAVRQYNVTLRSCILIQSLVRMMMNKSRMYEARYAAITIQALTRGFLTKKNVNQNTASCIIIQKFCRKMIYQSRFMMQKQSAIILQQYCRGMIIRKQYQRDYESVVLSQALVRGYNVRKQGVKALHSQILLAKNVRCFIELTRYQRARRGAVVIQSNVRCALASKHYQREKSNIIRCQSIIRRHQCTKVKNYSVNSVTVMAKNIRRFIAHNRFQRARSGAITIQKNIRASLASKQYTIDKNNVIKCQSIVRRHQCAMQRHAAIRSAVRVQSWYRLHVLRRKFASNRAAGKIISSKVRSFLLFRRFKRQKRSSRRLQVAIRSFLRNRLLANTIDKVFYLSAAGTQSEIEDMISLPSVAEYAHQFQRKGKGMRQQQYGAPDSSHIRQLLSIRHRFKDFCGILHEAACHGNNGVVQMLKPGPREILQKDTKGNSVAHYVARRPNLEIYEYLAEAMELRYNYNDLIRCGVLGKRDSRESQEFMEFENAMVDAGDDEDDDDIGLDEIKKLTAMARKVVKEGYLKKVIF